MAEETVLIKKYSNRKLYDLSRSRYITLEEIAGLIREGKQVKVVDAASNEDLTTVTLAQIILEEEKKHRNLLPVSFLHQLIKYGESLQELFQRQLSSSLETFVSTQMEAGRLLREWGMVGWTPKGWKLDQVRGVSAQQPQEGGEAKLQAELESLKERLKLLEKKIEETEKKTADDA